MNSHYHFLHLMLMDNGTLHFSNISKKKKNQKFHIPSRKISSKIGLDIFSGMNYHVERSCFKSVMEFLLE